MSLTDVLVETVEGLATFIGDVLHNSMPVYCELETSDSKDALVTGDGTLVSGIRVDGLIRAVGAEEFESTVSGLIRALQTYLQDPGHAVQVFFARDPQNVMSSLQNAGSGSKATCARLGLDVGDVFDSRIAHLAAFCADEVMYIGIWTKTSVLPSKEMSEANAKRKEALKKVPGISRSGQSLFSAYPELRDKHSSFLHNLEADLKSAGLSCTVLSAHEMLRAARQAIDPDFTADNWMPCLPGDKIPNVMRHASAVSVPRPLELSDVQYPPIVDQIFPRDGERIGTRYMTIGDRTYAPLFIDLPPREVMPFSELFKKLNKTRIPWRISVLVDGGGMRFLNIKRPLAKYLQWASSYNGLISEAVDLMDDAAVEGSVVRLRISLCTWAPAGDLDLLKRRASRLAQAVSTWGQAELREVSGDPMAGFVSTVPFVTSKSVATTAVAPLSHVVRMLPLMRPASVWRAGGMLYRTLDGKLMPFQPGSSQQTAWNYILFAKSGFGKSVQLASLLFASCVQAGIRRLPRIAILDIGPSSKGLINLIRDALPPAQKHYACHFKLRMTPDYAINPMDTQLGFRFPTPAHKAFLVNLMTQLATPPERNEAYESMSQLVSKVIDVLYLRFSDDPKSNPRRYSPGACADIDKLLQTYNFGVSRMVTWWQIVDFLFEKGHVHEATLAQRYAMPLISEATAATKDQAVVDLYGNVQIETTESLNDAFSRLIQDALRDYPILSKPTRFDIGDVRVAAIDIDEVAKSGSRAAERQTAVMYLIADHILSKDFKMDMESLQGVPSIYHEHHAKRILEIREDMKWIVYDEFHRTSGSFAVQNQVIVNMREGRKFNLGVILASQGVEDFPAAAKEFATGYWILNGGTEKNANELQKLLGFNDTAKQLLIDYANGPTAEGAPFLAHFNTSVGPFTQLLYSTIGPIEKWALSTTMEDVLVRDGVSTRVGPVRARSLLAKMYPNGAKAEVERIRIEAAETSISIDAIKQVIDTVLAEV